MYSSYGLCVFLFRINIDRKGETDYGIFLNGYGWDLDLGETKLSNSWRERPSSLILGGRDRDSRIS